MLDHQNQGFPGRSIQYIATAMQGHLWQEPLLDHLILQATVKGQVVQQAQRGQQQHFIVSSHEPNKAGDQATSGHLVLVLLVDGQLLQEDGAQNEQLYVAAV